jgi:hypothetical protein
VLAIRILSTCQLITQIFLGVRNIANRKLLREDDFVGLGERQSRDLLVATPDALEPSSVAG